MAVKTSFIALLALIAGAIVPTLVLAKSQSHANSTTSQNVITHSMVSTYQRATNEANAYCGTHKDASFPVAQDKDLQRIFNVDQAIRGYDIAPKDDGVASVWSSQPVNEFWRTEASYLQNVLDKPGALQRIFSDSPSLNPGTFELLTISMHVSRHAPEVGKAVAAEFRKLANGRDYMTAMAAQIEADVEHRATILKTPVAVAKLPKSTDHASCFSAASEYYKAAMLSQNTRLAARVLEELHSIVGAYGGRSKHSAPPQ